MNEQVFYEKVHVKAKESGLNPMLLLSGIEALYTFRHMPLNQINYDFLDSLTITIFALRIGDQFQALAEENLKSSDPALQLAAINELREITGEYIEQTQNRFLRSFVDMVGGKATIRFYHEKALEAAAMEVYQAQQQFEQKSISIIIMNVCKSDIGGKLDLSELFDAA